MQVCGFVVVYNNSFYPLFVLMHASLDFSACSCSRLSLSVSPRQNDVIFKQRCNISSSLFFGWCSLNTPVQILKASIAEWKMCARVCVCLYVWMGGAVWSRHRHHITQSNQICHGRICMKKQLHVIDLLFRTVVKYLAFAEKNISEFLSYT